MLTILSVKTSMDDKLDTLYDMLPIAWGENQAVADKLGVHRCTLRVWLKRLEAEGLAKRAGLGCWVENFDD